nr:hypothetical protein [Tanacetum cinerariifolium]
MNYDDTWEAGKDVTKNTSKYVSVKGRKGSTSKKLSCSKSTKTKPSKDLKVFDDSSSDDQGNVFRGKPGITSVYSKENRHLVSKKGSCSKKGSFSKGVIRGKPVESDVELKVVSVPDVIDAKRPPPVRNCILGAWIVKNLATNCAKGFWYKNANQHIAAASEEGTSKGKRKMV